MPENQVIEKLELLMLQIDELKTKPKGEPETSGLIQTVLEKILTSFEGELGNGNQIQSVRDIMLFTMAPLITSHGEGLCKAIENVLRRLLNPRFRLIMDRINRL